MFTQTKGRPGGEAAPKSIGADSSILPVAPRTFAGHRLFFWDGLPAVHDLSEQWQRALWELYDAGYSAGRVDGHNEGYKQADADQANLQRIQNEISRRTTGPTFAALCDRRGWTDRAERQRQLLRERGAQPWQLT